MLKKKRKSCYRSDIFSPHRRYEDIVFAVKELLEKNVPVKAIISGSSNFDKSYYQYIIDLINKYNLEKNVLIDSEFKTNDEIVGYYQFCDIFLFVGSKQNWGLAPLEAMLYKRPVIISKGVEVSKLMTHKKQAMIVNEKDPKEIVSSVLQLLNDSTLYKSLQENGREFVINNLTYEMIAEKLVRFISQYSQSK